MPAKQSTLSTPSPKSHIKKSTDKDINKTNSQDWKLARNKRSRSSPDEQNFIKRRQTHIHDYWLNKPIETKNAFLTLEQTSDGQITQNENINSKVNTQKSPPIYVSGGKTYAHLKKC